MKIIDIIIYLVYAFFITLMGTLLIKKETINTQQQNKISSLSQTIDSLTNNPHYPMRCVGVRTITAYCSYESETDKSPFLTKYQYNLKEEDKYNTCASNCFPFGTELFIDSLGWVKVVDGISKKYNDRIDIYFWMDKKEAMQFGKQERVVLVRY